MIGLIKKDLLMCKNNLKLLIVMLFLVFIMANTGNMDISFYPALISVMMFMSSFSYDEYNKWDSYAVALPNGRKNVVASKYIATLIIILGSIILTILLQIIIGNINKTINYEELFMTMAAVFFGVLIIVSVVYPFVFKFGIEKGRIGLFIGSFIFAFLIGFLMKTFKISVSQSVIDFLENYWTIIFCLVTMIILLISYKVSKRIYLNKEF